jgi:protein-export membrane protein SecD
MNREIHIDGTKSLGKRLGTTMKSFFWKIVICVVPVVLAVLAVMDALATNVVVSPFKLGVDLRGGTILVYEIDTRKLEERKKTDEKDQGAGKESAAEYYKQKAGELAEALKRRIDPTATYNIVIRPAGSEGRVEIILPTGGIEEARKAEGNWQKLLKDLEKEWGVKGLNVARGQVETLVDRIQRQLEQKNWRDTLFKKKGAWTRLTDKIKETWQQLTPSTRQSARNASSVVAQSSQGGLPVGPNPALAPLEVFRLQTPLEIIRSVPAGDVDQMSDTLVHLLEEDNPGKIDNWIKQQAWEEMIYQLVQWPELRRGMEKYLAKQGNTQKTSTKEFQAKVDRELEKLRKELVTIPVDSFAELFGRIEMRGDVIAQAALDAAEPLLGPSPPGPEPLLRRKTIEKKVEELYGPSEAAILATIKREEEGTGKIRDLTVEEVQRIKDLVAKVGALEFRILANEKDDEQAIKDAKQWIDSASRDPAVQAELEKAAVNGLPPPGPRKPGSKEPQIYEINLPNGNKSTVAYSWVELGKEARKDLKFNNGARTDAEKRSRDIWEYMNAHANEAVQVTDPARKDYRLWQGALFYRRESKDRNLPDKERRDKQYEYFVLTREPEYDSVTMDQTPHITGRYLTRASTDLHTGRPQVSFVFDAAGANLFGTLTGKNVPSGEGSEQSRIKRHLAIILDGLVKSAPTINSRIDYQGVITGDFTRKEVDNMVNILRSGALPASLKPEPVSESTMGASLGRDTIEQGIRAVFWAFIGVVVFMIIYYRFAGVVACLALFCQPAADGWLHGGRPGDLYAGWPGGAGADVRHGGRCQRADLRTLA